MRRAGWREWKQKAGQARKVTHAPRGSVRLAPSSFLGPNLAEIGLLWRKKKERKREKEDKTILVNCHMLFELTRKLALGAVMSLLPVRPKQACFKVSSKDWLAPSL